MCYCTYCMCVNCHVLVSLQNAGNVARKSHFLLLPRLPHVQQLSTFSNLHQYVVDGDMNELHKETNEAHDGEPQCCCQGDLLEL